MQISRRDTDLWMTLPFNLWIIFNHKWHQYCWTTSERDFNTAIHRMHVRICYHYMVLLSTMFDLMIYRKQKQQRFTRDAKLEKSYQYNHNSKLLTCNLSAANKSRKLRGILSVHGDSEDLSTSLLLLILPLTSDSPYPYKTSTGVLRNLMKSLSGMIPVKLLQCQISLTLPYPLLTQDQADTFICTHMWDRPHKSALSVYFQGIKTPVSWKSSCRQWLPMEMISHVSNSMLVCSHI